GSPYTLTKDTINFKDGVLTGELLNNKNGVPFVFELNLFEKSAARFKLNEKNPLKPRYDELKKFVIVNPPVADHQATFSVDQTSGVVTLRQAEEDNTIVIQPSPFQVTFYSKETPLVTLNERGFLNFEPIGEKPAPKLTEQTEENNEQETPAGNEEANWDEHWKGSTDSRPNGPSSIAMDISFPGFQHVYGIPEHASSLSLKTTRGGDNAYTDPYRLYNLDVFEYELDNPMALYGSIPFMMAHGKHRTVGVFWMNAAETWIDIEKDTNEKQTTTQTHWISESGVMDVFVFLGPTSSDIFRQYSSLTGYATLPQSFAIAYHQCRWNYLDDKDVASVEAGFDQHDIPVDVLWLDIEHTDGKRYFTWDEAKFPDPVTMQNSLSVKGRKLVTIVDPHIKRDDNYYIFSEAKEKNFFIKNKDGNDFDGWCWPGSSSWVDYTNPAARDWWIKQFGFDKYKCTTDSLFTWNDMNEPSVFSGPEITMPKDAIHHGNWEHRDLHNYFGVLFHESTANGQIQRSEVPKRPFVLSRAFYAGTQRTSAIWTGDNFARWDHLEASVPMLLTIGISGIPFSGADVGGFFGNPEPELLVRWYQAGAFQPFFRAHAHIDTKRREPWLFGEPYTSQIKHAIRTRYSLLPLWYTLFHEASVSGTPVIRPMFVSYPNDEAVFDMEDQYMVGEALLVKPIVTPDTESTSVYFPANSPWYNLFDYTTAPGSGLQTVSSKLDSIPAYIRGGAIVPKRERIRRSSTLMKWDPFTLVIALDNQGSAEGELYLDDGESYDYQSGAYIHRKFTFANGLLESHNLGENKSKGTTDFFESIKSVRVERLVVLGLANTPKSVTLISSGQKKELQVDCERTVTNNNVCTIKDPGSRISEDWKIEFSY
ncbi:glucosidase II, partial [Basidiobolus ranarum]